MPTVEPVTTELDYIGRFRRVKNLTPMFLLSITEDLEIQPKYGCNWTLCYKN